MVKIGIGYDAHRFVKGRPLIIGGVAVPFERGLEGHSDADVLLHAVGDAVLGAIGMGDIGMHFPDTDPRYKNISSLRILEQIQGMARSRSFRCCNVDAVLVAQEPKLAAYREEMQEHIARCLGVEPSAVNVKATTTEGMGFEGRCEGIAAHAVVLMEPF